MNIRLIGKYKLILEHTDGTKRVYEFPNQILATGLNLFPNLLSGGTANGQITHFAVGSGTSATTSGMTRLETESDRSPIASASANNNKFLCSGFFGITDAVGTINEIGLFANANDNRNNGTIFNRRSSGDMNVDNLPISKSNSETLTIEYELTFVNDTTN